MKIRTGFVLIIFLSSFIIWGNARADIHMAASCSYTDVNTAITIAASGDTVSVPAGNCDWGNNTLMMSKPIVLKGAGSRTYARTNIQTDNTSSSHTLILINTSQISANFPLRITGFQFTRTCGRTIWIEGSGFGWRLDNNRFLSTVENHDVNHIQSQAAGSVWSSFGLVDHNYFFWGLIGIGSSEASARVESWSNDQRMGNSDAVYFENNEFNYVKNAGETYAIAFMDSNNGGRYVFRYNDVYGVAASVQTHSTCGSSVWGGRHFEIYNNVFKTYTGHSTVPYVWIRAGSGIIARNVIGGNWSSGSGMKGKIRLSNRRSNPNNPGHAQCNSGGIGFCDSIDEGFDNQDNSTGYICHAQPGAGKITNGKFTSEPIYAWGNTAINICVGGARIGFECLTFDENEITGCPGSLCHDASTSAPNTFYPYDTYYEGYLVDQHIRLERDFFNNTTHPTWTPYTCPHPLAGSGSCNSSVAGTAGYHLIEHSDTTPPAAPSGLAVNQVKAMGTN